MVEPLPPYVIQNFGFFRERLISLAPFLRQRIVETSEQHPEYLSSGQYYVQAIHERDVNLERTKQSISYVESLRPGVPVVLEGGRVVTREEALTLLQEQRTGIIEQKQTIGRYRQEGYTAMREPTGELVFYKTETTSTQQPVTQTSDPSKGLSRSIEKKIEWLPPGLKEIVGFGYGASSAVYTNLKGLVSIIPGTEKTIKDIDRFFAVGTATAFTIPVPGVDEEKRLKYIAEHLQKVEASPQSYSPFESDKPYVFVGGLAGEGALAFGVGYAVAPVMGVVGKMGSGAIKLTGFGAKTVPKIASVYPYVAGGIFTGMAAGNITGTLALEQKGIVPRGSTAKIGLRTGVIFASSYAGFKAGSNIKTPSFKKQLVGREYTYSSGYKTQVIGAQRAINIFGKRIPISRFKPLVSRTYLEPDITSYTGIPERTPDSIIFTPSKTGPYYPPSQKLGIEPIPKDFAIVPYKSMVPSTQIGYVPIVFHDVISPSIFPTYQETFITNVYKPGIEPVSIKKFETIISWKGTPRDMMKPLGYREVMGKPKAMPDIKTHTGYPFKKIEISDWMDKQIPNIKSISTKVLPKPVVYRGRYGGIGGIAVTPFTSIRGPGIILKPWFIPFTKKPILPIGKPKPYVRVTDITGKQIGHEFIDITKKPIIKTKPSIKPKPDYTLKDSQIHYEKTKIEIGDTAKTPPQLRKNILGQRLLKGKGFLPKYETYKGGAIGIHKSIGKSLIIKPVTAITKRNLFLLFGTKPIIYGMIVYKPVKQPAIKSIRGFKGKTYSLKDLTKKWEMEKPIDKNIIYAPGTKEQILLLEKPKTYTKPIGTIKYKSTTDLQKISIRDLKKIGRFDLEQPIVYPPGTGKLPSKVLPIPISFYIPLIKSERISQSKVKTDIKSVFQVETSQLSLIDIESIQGKELKFDQGTIIISDMEQFQLQKQGQIQSFQFDLIHDTFQLQKQKQKPPIPPPILFSEIPIKEKPKHDSYHVLVKPRQYKHGKRINKGKPYRITKKPLSYEDAKAYGAHIVGKNAKATFILEQSNKSPGKLPSNVDPWHKVILQYDIKDDNRFVERNKFRIDSPGEIREISMRGWNAPRRKKTKNRRYDKL